MYHSWSHRLGPSRTPPPRLPLLRAAPHSPLLGAPQRGLCNPQLPPSRPRGITGRVWIQRPLQEPGPSGFWFFLQSVLFPDKWLWYKGVTK